MSLLLLLLGCPGKDTGDSAGPPLPDCPTPANEGWVPEVEPEARLDETTAAWASEDGADFDPAWTTCGSGTCVRVTGPGSVHTEMWLNRGVTYQVSGVAETDGRAGLRVVQNERGAGPTVLLDELLEGGAFLYEFELTGAGTTTSVELRPTGGVTLVVDEIRVEGPQWARQTGAAAAPVDLAFVLHIEENVGFETDERLWSTRARIVEGISQRLAAHGAALSVQPDVGFIRGAALWDPTWLEARAAEGLAWSAHLHDEADGAEAFSRAARDAMRGFADAGVTLTDLNGGFGTGPWAEVGAVGYSTVSVYKSPLTQLGLATAYTTPWRLAEGADASDEAAFATHAPDGPVVFLPGTGTRETDLARLPEYGDRILSQVRAHARPGFTNTWYLTDHIDAYATSDDVDEVEAWLDAGGLDEALAPYDQLLGEVTDPLVASGELRYATLPGMGAAFLAWESTCAW